MGRRSCEDCRSLEEDIYWTHFGSIHFCQFLVGDFRSQLIIPEKFSEKVGFQLSDNLLLRGPSGRTWEVTLGKNGETSLFFGAGWEEFVTAHSLSEKDILLFRYNGRSQFDVMMFNGMSLCERAESYFVRKCGPAAKGGGGGGDSSSMEITEEEGNSDVGVEPESASKVDSESAKEKEKEKELLPMTSPTSVVQLTAEVDDGDNDGGDLVSTPVVLGLEENGVLSLEEKRSILLEKLKLRCSGSSLRKKRKTEDDVNIYHVCFASNRRPVTETEKAKALDEASKDLPPESFLLVMRATHVYKRFYVTLPAHWMATYLPHRKQDVILRMGELTWKTRFLVSGDGRGGLSRGWQDFALDNNLEEFDVCVFKLVESAGNDEDTEKPATLEVSIFRVVDEVVPPTRLTSPPVLTSPLSLSSPLSLTSSPPVIGRRGRGRPPLRRGGGRRGRGRGRGRGQGWFSV